MTDPAPRGGARGRPLRVAHRAALQALRAARPGALEHRRRRRRRDARAHAGRARREARLGAEDRARPDARVERLPGHERRLDGPARGLPDGLDLRRRPGQGQRRPDRAAAADRDARPPARHARARVRPLGGRGLEHRRRRAGRRLRPGRRPLRRGLARATSRARRGRAAPHGHRTLYDVSAMVLAGLEDKTYRGAGIASPSMAWVWGTIPGYSGPYHLVWSRDLYQVATAQIAAGDRAAAGRALDYLWTRQQPPTAASRRTATSTARRTGRPAARRGRRPGPARLAARAHRCGDLEPRRARGRLHPRAAARRRRSGGRTPRRYSPATIAAEIAALVCAAEIAERNGAAPPRRATARRPTSGSARVEGWTRTTNGPLSSEPYYLRLTPTATPTRARRTRSATAAPRSTSGASSTPASSSSCGSASSPPTTPPSARRCRSSTASSA